MSPKYYKGWAVGDFIFDMGLGFFTGNAVKYLCRWREKNGLEDLQKMQVYLNRILEMYTVSDMGTQGLLIQNSYVVSPIITTCEERESRIVELIALFGLTSTEASIVRLICDFVLANDLQHIRAAIDLGQTLLDTASKG